MRLDRLLTLSLFQSIPRLGGVRLPILMYHSVSEDQEESVGPSYRTVTSPDIFVRHMALLKSGGYHGVTLGAGLAWLTSHDKPRIRASGSPHHTRFALNPQPVVITFDDGFRDFYTDAFPVLEQHGFGATMFLPTALIGDERRRFKSRECMTWSEARDLHRSGVEFGSHTVNHPRLVDLDWLHIERELSDSRTEIERRLGTPARTFAYPYAFPKANRPFVHRFRRLLDQSGYECCVTTEIGRVRRSDDRLRLCRLPVNSADDDRLLQAKLEGAYDWMAAPQAWVKMLKHWLLGRIKQRAWSS